MKKIIALLLCAVMATASFAACGNNGDESKPEDSSSAPAVSETVSDVSDEESKPEEINYLEKIYTGNDYNGKTFTFLTSGVNATATSEIVYNEDLTDSENFPETINEAIKRRNDAVYDLLGVEIKEIYFHDPRRYGGDTLAKIRNSASAGDNSFQAVSVCLYDCGTLATENYLFDLTTLENLHGLEYPWWDEGFSNTVRIAGKQYFMLGDMGINYKNSTPCVYYNQSLFEKLGLENPQQLAIDGKWTIDKAIELSTSYHDDINGTDGIQWDDCYGWCGQNDDMPSMLYGAGVRIVSSDSEGYPYLTLWSETANNAVEKVLELMLNSDYYVSGNDWFGKTGNYEWPMQALEANFIAGHVLFYSGGISTAINLSAMEDSFGILPVPKLTEEQDDYYSLLNTWTTNAYAITTNNTEEQAEFAAAVLEAMGYYSWEGNVDSLAVAYYERVLKMQKLKADETSTALLDLIFAQRGCELGSVFRIGNITGSKSVNDILGTLINEKKTGAFRSTYEAYESILEADVEAVVEYFKS
ncbi:MAG: hypothetical protein PT943_03060 [Ruminococcus sp.]|nr:hypothetical protein [Ruminococcus sp.]